jgi:chlorite dismutase
MIRNPIETPIRPEAGRRTKSSMEERDAVETASLGHFATYRLTDRFWSLDSGARRARARAWWDGLAGAADAAQLYLVRGVESEADVLVWSTSNLPDEQSAGTFFTVRAGAENAGRDVIEPGHVLWGMTRPSEYSRAAKSAQEIDPFSGERAPYLVMYPFTKTADWYLLGREARQGMMNEHIRIGKQYREIRQLLLYSFGLQDQEFVVVYETADLALFSKLVYDLRDTEARRYTRSDTPLHTGIRVSVDAWLESLG